MNFYKYLIFKLYNWGLKSKNDTPVANVIITLTIVHFIQLLSVSMILKKLFPQINIFNNVGGIYIVIFLIGMGILHYFIIYNKKRWERYIEEFKNEDIVKSRKGTILVLSYLIGSILFFFLLLPLLFGF